MIGEKLLRPEKTYYNIRKSWWWDGFNRIGWSDDSPRWWLGEPDRNPRIRPHQNKDWDEVDMLPEKNQFKLGDRFAGDPRPYDYYHYENYFWGDTWGDLPECYYSRFRCTMYLGWFTACRCISKAKSACFRTSRSIFGRMLFGVHQRTLWRGSCTARTHGALCGATF